VIDWTVIPTIVLGVVLGVVACIVIYFAVSLLCAGLYIAWYFVFIEWPDSIRWWWRNRSATREEG
jgi:hypothetical protein